MCVRVRVFALVCVALEWVRVRVSACVSVRVSVWACVSLRVSV